MKTRYTAMFVAAALVAGAVAGSAMTGLAAPVASTVTTTAAACAGTGMRLGGAMREAGGRLADVVAGLTGLDVTDVQAKRQAGESFEEIAKGEGVDATAVVDEALEVRKSVLDARVADGSITREQADAAYDRMQDRLKERVSSTTAGCNGAGGGQGGRGAGFGGGCGGGGCAQAPIATQ